MAAPRPRRRRIRQLIILLNNQAITALDNEQDGTIWETGLPILARCLPLDDIEDENLTNAQSDVTDHLETIESVFQGEPTAETVEELLCEANTGLADLCTAAGL